MLRPDPFYLHWHGHPKRFIMPKSNKKYWETKIDRNRKRDRKVSTQLKKDSWKVIRIWEYDIKHNIEKCVKRILKAIE